MSKWTWTVDPMDEAQFYLWPERGWFYLGFKEWSVNLTNGETQYYQLFSIKLKRFWHLLCSCYFPSPAWWSLESVHGLNPPKPSIDWNPQTLCRDINHPRLLSYLLSFPSISGTSEQSKEKESTDQSLNHFCFIEIRLLDRYLIYDRAKERKRSWSKAPFTL